MANDKFQRLYETEICKNNFFVCCPGENRKCYRCGWNPVVSAKRRARIRAARRRKLFGSKEGGKIG